MNTTQTTTTTKHFTFYQTRPRVYTYTVDLFERDEFRASIYNENGRCVFEIDGFEIFEDGFMRNRKDVGGLQSYLQDLNVMPANSTLRMDN